MRIYQSNLLSDGATLMLFEEHSDHFTAELIACQERLYSYILTLLPNPDQASDVLQQTNMVLWRDADAFAKGTNFIAWAYRVAYFQVLAHREKQGRDRHFFSHAMIETLAADGEQACDEFAERREAMQHCLKSLHPEHQQLLLDRYYTGTSVKAMASRRGVTPGSVSTRLHRIRRGLLKCIEQRMGKRGDAKEGGGA